MPGLGDCANPGTGAGGFQVREEVTRKLGCGLHRRGGAQVAGALGDAREHLSVWSGPGAPLLPYSGDARCGAEVVRAGPCGPSPWGSSEEDSLVSSWGLTHDVSVDDKGSM